ncbi:MAG: hypothetical protein JSV62_08520 [Promethearchaeota archaeon]|nr:MAG: hypothetical protein JSV62_08520 [Candidatus Lokiarchaeota archaeon]
MNNIWDIKADAVQKGDKLRNVSPLHDKTGVDDNGFTHYVFSKLMFNNPWYKIPDNELELFNKYLEGGSRAYPSDGKIPCDIVATEARNILNKIVEISKNPQHTYYKDACEAIQDGKNSLIRGTLKLYLGKYTSRDWRRKRFTDDLDFWVFKVHLLDHVLREMGWTKNKETGEFEKTVQWTNPDTGEVRHEALCAANNLNQLLDFGAGSYLEGTKLGEIFNKKLKRGHDVDLSDIMNVVLYNDGLIGRNRGEWNEAWVSFEAATNTRNSRITSNLISLCRYSLGTADYLERVSKAIDKYHERVLDKNEYSDEKLEKICRMSKHWIKYLEENGSDKTRNMIHEFLLEQMEEKLNQAYNLKSFTEKVLKLLNSKYEYLKIRFEIEN